MYSEQINQREKWADIFKGILIFCVVLGHSNFIYSDIIYWFSMPLFYDLWLFLER